MLYILAALLAFAAFWSLYEARDLPPSQFYWVWGITLTLAALAGVTFYAA